MTYITSFIEAIPQTWWAAIGGAMLALLGAAANHFGESRRLERRFQQESQVRRRERDDDLRRQVYLEAADAAVSATRIFSALANTSIPLQQLNLDPVNVAGLSKAHLVGSLETIKAFDRVSVSLRSQTLRLTTRRMVVEIAKDDIDTVNRHIEEVLTMRRDLVARQQALNREPTLQADAMAGLHNLFESTNARIDELFQERDRLTVVWHEHLRVFMLDCMQATADFGVALAKANVLVRRELEQTDSFDAAEYERHIEATLADARDEIQQFATEMMSIVQPAPPASSEHPA